MMQGWYTIDMYDRMCQKDGENQNENSIRLADVINQHILDMNINSGK